MNEANGLNKATGNSHFPAHICSPTTRLRSADCGGHLTTVNSLLCSRNQCEMLRDMVYNPAGNSHRKMAHILKIKSL